MILLTRNRNYLAVTICILLCTAICLQGQESGSIRFDRYASENVKLVKGLSQNWIYSILQDQEGYIWFGTWDGLNKFDGYNFTIYNVSNGLSDHTILSMVEDEAGNLWLGTNKGLNKFDRESQSFITFENIPGDTSSLYRNRVNALLLSKDGKLWLGTGGGLVCYDMETEVFTSFLTTAQEYTSPRSNYIIHLMETYEGDIWVATTYGLVIFEPEEGRSTRYYHIPDDPNSLSDNNIRYLMQARNGSYWIGTRNGLNVYDTITEKLTRYYHDPNDPNSLSDDYIRKIFQDRSGKIWIGTDGGGLSYFEPSMNGFIHFKNDIDDRNSLSNDKVYDIFEDRSGNIWVGTYFGVNKINKYTNNFGLKQQTQAMGENKGLNNNFIWSFEEDDKNNLWIGTSNGINIENLDNGSYQYMAHDPNNINSLAGNEVRAILFSKRWNCFWFGLYGTGLDRYDLETGEFKHYAPNPQRNSLTNIYVNDLLEDDDGFLWIATARGLNRLDPATNEITVYEHHVNDTNSLSNSIIISLFEDMDGQIWAGTDHGLNKYLPDENRFVRYFHTDDYQLADNSIFYIQQDQAGRFWLGTSGGGLIRFNPDNNTYKVYTTRDQMPNDIIYGILEDNENNLWVSTNRGLVKFYVIGERIVTYDVKDGIQSYEFNLGSCYKDHTGKLYFGGMNGYNYFDPGEIISNPNPPVVVVTAFRKFNELQPVEMHHGDTIHLRHDENFFSFEISALDYTNPSKNKYRYFLEGVDNDWINTDANDRLAAYKNVRPGTYTFYANGTNNDGIWNETGVILTIHIQPPWYGTWIFRIVFVLFVISVLWIIIYRRIQRIRRKNQVERKMLDIEKQKFELEQQALRLQMNPHFIFNSLNSIQSYILTHDTEMAVTYLGKFSQLMRLILANSGNNFVPLKEELQSIRYYLDLEKLRFENKFDYILNVDSRIDEEFIEIPPMVVQPYIENAIIHGLLHKKKTGHLQIDFMIKGESLYCSITDNGVGREAAREIREKQGIHRKSSGMHITKARLEMLNKKNMEDFAVRVTDLKDNEGKSTGTKVELMIQYQEDQ
ncbi:MAG: histidine kinase [Bacteroidetes bacterium]|nr:histidine kinase [Bacteroidota bacterium]